MVAGDFRFTPTRAGARVAVFKMIICADDYGLSDDVDRAILELCGAGRLSAVSCMVVLERCDSGTLKKLLAHQDQVDVGLHFCVADETLPGFPAYGPYLRRSLLGRISPHEIFLKVSAQYETFLQKCGRRPDYIDGHLHAHQLPGVREGLIQFVQSLPANVRPYIRNTCEPLQNLRRLKLPWLKASFIGAFGKRMLADLRAAGLATNDGFAGIYDFRSWRKYPDYFPRFVACLGARNGILVVHPGGREDWRRQEFETLRAFPFAPGAVQRFQKPAWRPEKI